MLAGLNQLLEGIVQSTPSSSNMDLFHELKERSPEQRELVYLKGMRELLCFAEQMQRPEIKELIKTKLTVHQKQIKFHLKQEKNQRGKRTKKDELLPEFRPLVPYLQLSYAPSAQATMPSNLGPPNSLTSIYWSNHLRRQEQALAHKRYWD